MYSITFSNWIEKFFGELYIFISGVHIFRRFFLFDEDPTGYRLHPHCQQQRKLIFADTLLETIQAKLSLLTLLSYFSFFQHFFVESRTTIIHFTSGNQNEYQSFKIVPGSTGIQRKGNFIITRTVWFLT
jgi:hypothetical protein